MTTMVIPAGRYQVQELLHRPTLNQLVAMKQATGVGMQTVRAGLVKFDELVKATVDGGAAVVDLVDIITGNDQVLTSFKVMIWLARHVDGEKLTLDQALDFPFDEFDLVADTDGAIIADEPDPTMPATDSDPDAGHPADL